MSPRTLCVLLLLPLTIATAAPVNEAPEFVLYFGGSGSSTGRFNFPLGLDVDAVGNVYVADFHNHRIQKFDNDGSYLSEWGSPGSLPGQFNFPEGLAVGPSGDVYVADRNNNRIQKFDANGNFVLEWGGSCDIATGVGCVGDGRGQFNYPWALGVDDNENVFVADFLNHRIQKFDSEGGFLQMWGQLGTADGEFSTPQGVAIDPAGFVYVSDNLNHRIQKFTNAGQFVLKWGSLGSLPGEFHHPSGLESDDQGLIHVVDHLNYRIQVFDGDGQFQYLFGYRSINPGGLGGPWDVTIDHAGNVFVSEKDHNRISKFGIPEPEEPIISTVLDVGSDQGGRVRINFARSRHDISGAYPVIRSYEVYRRIDPGRKSGQQPSTQIAGWEHVGAIPSHQEREYNIVVETVVDKKAHGNADIPWTAYFVRAATSDPGVFFDSQPDSGYSVDNIPPAKPRDLTGAVVASKVNLMWQDAALPDLAAHHWQVYRGPSVDFPLDASALLAAVEETQFSDDVTALEWPQVCYKLVAMDAAGNSSESATIAVQLTGSRVSFAMTSSNPVRGAARLSYNLPFDSPVEIKIFSAQGRLVRSAEMPAVRLAGRYSWEWDLRDDSANQVAPGIYFARFATPAFKKTLKAVVVR